MRALRPIAWDIYEKHLDEAAFLWTQWEDALVTTNYTLHDVAEDPEARLLTHLDGLVLGGKPVAERLLLPALCGDEPDHVAPAAWALLQAEHDADYHDAVIDAWVNAEPALSAAIARALGVSPRVDLSRVARLWSSATPQIRAAVFDLLSAREPTWAAPFLEATVRADECELVAAALRALRRSGDRTMSGYVAEALRRDLGSAKSEAIRTGVVFGLERAWDACRQVELSADNACRLPLALLATRPDQADRSIVLTAAISSPARRHALWALGFAGDSAAAEVLVAALSDETLAKVAGEALAAITGIAFEGQFVVHGKTQGPGVDEVGDDDPPPSVSSEDHLPTPSAIAVARWWQRERARFAPGVRHSAGVPRTHTELRALLLGGAMWRREVVWLELAMTGARAPALDLRTWAHEQARALAVPQ